MDTNMCMDMMSATMPGMQPCHHHTGSQHGSPQLSPPSLSQPRQMTNTAPGDDYTVIPAEVKDRKPAQPTDTSAQSIYLTTNTSFSWDTLRDYVMLARYMLLVI